MDNKNNTILQFKLDIFKQVMQDRYNKKELDKEFLYSYIHSLQELNILSEEEHSTIISLFDDYINALLVVFGKSRQIKCLKNNK